MIQRQTTTTRARMDQVKATASFNTISALNMTATPSVMVARSVDVGTVDLEPTLTTVDITGTRQPDNKIDMALDMLDVNSMDTGRYRAMLVQEQGDPQAIKGFINFARVISASATSLRHCYRFDKQPACAGKWSQRIHGYQCRLYRQHHIRRRSPPRDSHHPASRCTQRE